MLQRARSAAPVTYVTGGDYSYFNAGSTGRATLWLYSLGGFFGLGHTWLRVLGHPSNADGTPVVVPDPASIWLKHAGGCLSNHDRNVPMQLCGGASFAGDSGGTGCIVEGRVGIGLLSTMIDVSYVPESDDQSRPSEFLILFAVGVRGAW